jgi:hypothetical protein
MADGWTVGMKHAEREFVRKIIYDPVNLILTSLRSPNPYILREQLLIERI